MFVCSACNNETSELVQLYGSHLEAGNNTPSALLPTRLAHLVTCSAKCSVVCGFDSRTGPANVLSLTLVMKIKVWIYFSSHRFR